MGRKPATGGLSLDVAGVATDGSRVVVDATQATSQPSIFAAGDVSSEVPVVHTAITQGETAATNAAVHLGKLPASRRRRVDDRLKLFGVFTHPQAAAVGLSEMEARAEAIDYRVAKYPFDDHGKSMVMGETEGFVKLLTDAASGEILGGAVVGPEAVELIHEIAVAMHFRATAQDLALVPHYHPTLSEIWTYPAEELADEASA
jgi:pyruvate/2-oxoglutarate dehydrogenase complex dihydrolipoamide dehydrogenase (E3) component